MPKSPVRVRWYSRCRAQENGNARGMAHTSEALLGQESSILRRATYWTALPGAVRRTHEVRKALL
jgi:hypothetical protein